MKTAERGRRIAGLTAIVAMTWITGLVAAPDSAGDRFWPQWRGPHATGVSKSANPPLEWSETRNVRWKVEIPGHLDTGKIVWESHGTTMNATPSPVAADGMVFVTSGFRGNNLKAIRLADARGDGRKYLYCIAER
jgi:hypothetical protein